MIRRYLRDITGFVHRGMVALEQIAGSLEVIQVILVEAVEEERRKLDQIDAALAEEADARPNLRIADPKCRKFERCSPNCESEGPHTYNESSKDGRYDECPGGGI